MFYDRAAGLTGIDHRNPRESAYSENWHALCKVGSVPEGFAHMKRVGPVWSLSPTRFNPPFEGANPKRKQVQPTAALPDTCAP